MSLVAVQKLVPNWELHLACGHCAIVQADDELEAQLGTGWEPAIAWCDTCEKVAGITCWGRL